MCFNNSRIWGDDSAGKINKSPKVAVVAVRLIGDNSAAVSSHVDLLPSCVGLCLMWFCDKISLCSF